MSWTDFHFVYNSFIIYISIILKSLRRLFVLCLSRPGGGPGSRGVQSRGCPRGGSVGGRGVVQGGSRGGPGGSRGGPGGGPGRYPGGSGGGIQEGSKRGVSRGAPWV